MTRDEAVSAAAEFLYDATGDLLDEFTFAEIVDEVADDLLWLSLARSAGVW